MKKTNIYNLFEMYPYMILVTNTKMRDFPFNAGYKYCVSNYIARECKIPTYQIEINLKYRLATYKEYEKYKDLLKSLEEIVEFIIEKSTIIMK